MFFSENIFVKNKITNWYIYTYMHSLPWNILLLHQTDSVSITENIIKPMKLYAQK